MLKARDIIAREPEVIDGGTSVRQAALRMIDKGTDSLIVNRTGRDEPYGILTARDIADVVSAERRLDSTRVDEVASTPLVVVSPGVPASRRPTWSA